MQSEEHKRRAKGNGSAGGKSVYRVRGREGAGEKRDGVAGVAERGSEKHQFHLVSAVTTNAEMYTHM